MPWLGYGQAATDPTPLSPSDPSIPRVPAIEGLAADVTMLRKTSVLPKVKENWWEGAWRLQYVASQWIAAALTRMVIAEGVPADKDTPARGLALLRQGHEQNPEAFAQVYADGVTAWVQATRALKDIIRLVARIRQSTPDKPLLNLQRSQETEQYGGTTLHLAKWLAPTSALPGAFPPKAGYPGGTYYRYPLTLPITGPTGEVFVVKVLVGTAATDWRDQVWTTPNFNWWVHLQELATTFASQLDLVEEAYGKIPGTQPVSHSTPPAEGFPPAALPPVQPPTAPPGGPSTVRPSQPAEMPWKTVGVATAVVGALAIWGWKSKSQVT